jgi:hypothetical protein
MSRRRITAALGAAAVTLILATGGAAGRAGGPPGQQPPSDQSPPSISGSAVVASTLTASTGTWQGKSLKFAYQWLRCDSAGGTCSAISGATASAKTVSTADAGSTLRVIVTASNRNGSTAATSAQTAAVATASSPPPPSAAPPTTTSVAPADSSLPVVSGTAQQSQTLTTSTGSWSGTTPMTYSYQWQRCDGSGASCAPVFGATAASYVLAAADVGSTLRASVTASNSAGSATASSTATASVGALPTPSSPSSPSSCNSCYFDWEGNAPGNWPGVVPSPLNSSWMFPVDSGAATAIKITTGGSPSGSNGTIASLYFGSGSQYGQHTANGESTWYRERIRFPGGGLYVPVVGDWNIHNSWHTQFGCGALSNFVGVRGSGSNSSLPATSAQLVIALRGGTLGSGSCPDATQEVRYADPAPLLYDHWYDIVVHFVWKPSGGSVQWYVDGQLIYSNSSLSTLLTYNGQVDQPGFGIYNYRQDMFSGSSRVDFDQTLIGPTAASVGFTP